MTDSRLAEPQRYNFDPDGCMEQDENGRWVLYEDYERLRAELGKCDHRWKYETFFQAMDGKGPQHKYRCNRCLQTKWVPE